MKRQGAVKMIQVHRAGRILFPPILGAGLVCAFLSAACSNAVAVTVPSVTLGLEKSDSPEKVAVGLVIVALLTVLSIAPSILLMMTSFTRIVVVFGFLRQAVGTQQAPPNQVLIGLALFMTFFIMRPVWQQANATAIEPFMNDEISFKEAVERVQVPLREFMFRQTREADLALFAKMAKIDDPKDRDAIPTSVLIPSFMISELKTAFEIGFILFIPFLIIDMVVSSVLLSMGMMMLPPVMISLPFKLLLFVLVDGWNILAGSLVRSFVAGG